MKVIRPLLIHFIIFVLFLIIAGTAYAQTPPDFPACSNPQGTLKVSYNSGTHGIPGDTAAYTGSDSVYSLDNDRTLQCFCSTNGSGIQTNWWKISSLDQEEIDTLKGLGWVFIPSGSVWGLDSSAYMAKNSSYTCGGGSSTSTVASASTGIGGSVLAATGTSLQVLVLLSLGLIFILSGRLLKRKV